MDYATLASSSASSEAKMQRLMLGVSCAALLVAGLLYAATGSSSVQHSLQVQQPLVQQQMRMVVPQPHLRANNYVPNAAVHNMIPSTLAAAAQDGQKGATMQNQLSLVAGFTVLAAALVTLMKHFKQVDTNPTVWSTAASLGELMGKKSDDKKPSVTPEKLGMDQVALAIKEEQARSKSMTPKEVVLELQRGNARFWSGMPERPEMNAMERRALIMAQAPMVCILSCADSRVPVEILFDQGLGRVFVVRVAGNILDPTAMGSIEFSVKYLGVKVVLVMGHEACGAVKGAMTMSNDDIDKQPAYLQLVLRSIRSNLDLEQLKKMRDSRAQDRQAIVTNTYAQVKAIQENKLISDRVANGSLLVCGAFYEITSGMVDFFTLDKNGLVIDI